MFRYGDADRGYGYGVYGGLDAAQWCCQASGSSAFVKPEVLNPGFTKLEAGAGEWQTQEALPAEECTDD